ncbi:MAG TPA: CDP-alcohol phosphatidyltransferase family protein [Acidimicrobiales bacterium]|jgi:CDP-diacylglycerol--glycerol-3-phosphate 3-phosphatidyltransferase|nr:CDP-alcohol phosphatidyltransferase family protein [Acidimicrobiales bacterium]
MSTHPASPATFGPSALATPANAVTLARLAATPLLMGLIAARGASWATVAVWFIIASTDGVDGYIARRMGTTRSGAFLDPLADKVCVLGAMVALVWRGTFWWLPVGVIAVRELGLVGYRSFLGRRGVSMPASQGAKVKTLVQSLAVGAALLPTTARYPQVGGVLLWAAVALTLVTGAQYLLDGRRASLAT